MALLISTAVQQNTNRCTVSQFELRNKASRFVLMKRSDRTNCSEFKLSSVGWSAFGKK